MMLFYQLQKKTGTSLGCVTPSFLNNSGSFIALHIQIHFIEHKEKKVIKKSLSQGMLVGFSGSPNVSCTLS